MGDEFHLSGSPRPEMVIYIVSDDHHYNLEEQSISPPEKLKELSHHLGDELKKDCNTENTKDITLQIPEETTNMEQKRKWTILETIKMWQLSDMIELLKEVGLWSEGNGVGYCLLLMMSSVLILVILMSSLG